MREGKRRVKIDRKEMTIKGSSTKIGNGVNNNHLDLGAKDINKEFTRLRNVFELPFFH